MPRVTYEGVSHLLLIVIVMVVAVMSSRLYALPCVLGS